LIRSPGHTFSDTLGPRDLAAVVSIRQSAGSWVANPMNRRDYSTLFKMLSYSTQIDTILGPRDQRKKKEKGNIQQPGFAGDHPPNY